MSFGWIVFNWSPKISIICTFSFPQQRLKSKTRIFKGQNSWSYQFWCNLFFTAPGPTLSWNGSEQNIPCGVEGGPVDYVEFGKKIDLDLYSKTLKLCCCFFLLFFFYNKLVYSHILYRAHWFISISNHFVSYTDRTRLEDALDKQVSKSKLLGCCIAQLV